MNFDFNTTGDTKQLLIGSAANNFVKAKGKTPNAFKYREWLRDVVDYFQGHIFLTRAQSIQLIVTGDFSRAKRMHGLHMEKAPRQISAVIEGREAMIPNPTFLKYESFVNMQDADHIAFIRNQFTSATSLRGPDERAPSGFKPAGNDVALQKVTKLLKHANETKEEAHFRRTVVALGKAVEGGEISSGEVSLVLGMLMFKNKEDQDNAVGPN